MYNKMGVFVRAFPVPKYLSMPAVGVDISDYAIKYCALEKKNGRIELKSYGKIDLPLDVIERGEIKDPETIVKLLDRVREENNFEFANLALPEEHAYLFQMDIPRGNRAQVEQMLEFHLKENVPIGADEAVFDYEVLREKKDEFELNVSVYPSNIAAQYVNVLEEAGFKILSVEIEGQATARALIGEKDLSPMLIIDIGRNDASLSISTGGVVTFTANLETGGDYFTRAIARGLDVSFQEAEKLKRKHGFCDSTDSKMVFDELLPVVSKFGEAIHKHLMYWHMHMHSAGGSEEVSRVVLVGGNANIAGLAEYLEVTLGVSVEVGDVWKNVFSYEEYIPNIHASSSLEYTTAIGLALRSLLQGS
jgi:type IV pilus assembly protein PilM